MSRIGRRGLRLLAGAACLLAVPLACGARAQGWDPAGEAAGPEAPAGEPSRGVLPAEGALPAQVDLAAEVPPPRTQGPANTCTSWAATYAAASAALRAQAGPQGARLTLSPAFTYALAGGAAQCMGPTSIQATLDVLRDVGSLPVEAFAVDAGWCGRRPTREERERAAAFRIPGWSRLPEQDLTAVKARIARHAPVIFGMRVGPLFRAHRGAGTFDTAETGADTMGHAMVAIGYDDDRGAFRIQNSAGTGWGEGGRAWLSYRLWRQQVRAAFAIDAPRPDAPRR